MLVTYLSFLYINSTGRSVIISNFNQNLYREIFLKAKISLN